MKSQVNETRILMNKVKSFLTERVMIGGLDDAKYKIDKNKDLVYATQDPNIKVYDLGTGKVGFSKLVKIIKASPLGDIRGYNKQEPAAAAKAFKNIWANNPGHYLVITDGLEATYAVWPDTNGFDGVEDLLKGGNVTSLPFINAGILAKLIGGANLGKMY
jgi:hypothetical protein